MSLQLQCGSCQFKTAPLPEEGAIKALNSHTNMVHVNWYAGREYLLSFFRQQHHMMQQAKQRLHQQQSKPGNNSLQSTEASPMQQAKQPAPEEPTEPQHRLRQDSRTVMVTSPPIVDITDIKQPNDVSTRQPVKRQSSRGQQEHRCMQQHVRQQQHKHPDVSERHDKAIEHISTATVGSNKSTGGSDTTVGCTNTAITRQHQQQPTYQAAHGEARQTDGTTKAIPDLPRQPVGGFTTAITMAEAALAPAKKAPKAKNPAVKPAHPPYQVMITDAIKALKESGGCSRKAILMHIVANNKIADEDKTQVRV